MLLQWSRSFSTAEIVILGGCAMVVRDASMEPQFFNCGNLLFAGSIIPNPWSFNGAAVFQLRKSIHRVKPLCTWKSFNGAAVFQLRKWFCAVLQ